MNMNDVLAFHGACRKVVHDCPDPYAKAYANAGLMLMSPAEVRAQCLYILSNMRNWRGDEARECRAILKGLSRERKEQ